MLILYVLSAVGFYTLLAKSAVTVGVPALVGKASRGEVHFLAARQDDERLAA